MKYIDFPSKYRVSYNLCCEKFLKATSKKISNLTVPSISGVGGYLITPAVYRLSIRLRFDF